MRDHACFIICHLVDAFIHCERACSSFSSRICHNPFSALLLTIKNTTLNHKLIVLAAQTFLRGRNNLTGWGKPQVGGDKDSSGEEEEAVILKLVKQQIEAARCLSEPTVFLVNKSELFLGVFPAPPTMIYCPIRMRNSRTGIHQTCSLVQVRGGGS